MAMNNKYYNVFLNNINRNNRYSILSNSNINDNDPRCNKELVDK